MQVLRWLFIALLLLTSMGMVQAQETAYELPALESGDTVQGRFEDNVISQLYGFYATAGDVLSIGMSQEDDNLDPFLVLFNSEGAVLAYDDDSGEPQLAALIDGYEVEEDGVYFVLATSLYYYLDGTENETSETQDYSLSISGQNTPADTEDANNVSLELNPLDFGSSVEGESSEANPVAFFIFEAEAGTSISLSVETDGFDSVLYLFAPDGSRIAIDPSLVSIELEDDGVYLVMVADWQFYQAIDDDGDFEGGEFSLALEN